MKLLLGSQSPRRRELLSGLDIPFECVRIDADESFPADLQAGDIPLYIAKQKAQAYLDHLHEGELLLTADTIVWVDGRMLGKPQDTEEATAMLHLLSGKTHQVFTGVSLTFPEPLPNQPRTNSEDFLPFQNQFRTNALETPTIIQWHTRAFRQESFVDRTDVTFRTLTDAEIAYYIDRYRPFDKAGSYGVQEYIGYIGVEAIVGSFYNVMGLPIDRVYCALERIRN